MFASKIRRSTFWLGILVFSNVVESTSGEIVYDDGGEHVLEGSYMETVTVSNQSFLDLRASLDLNSDAPVLSVDNAAVELTGTISNESNWAVALENSARLIVNDGYITGSFDGGPALRAVNSYVKLNGQINGLVSLEDGSHFVFDDGILPAWMQVNLRIRDSTADLNGGRILGGLENAVDINGSSVVRIDGTTVSPGDPNNGGVVISDMSKLHLANGLIATRFRTDAIVASGKASVSISGGTVQTKIEYGAATIRATEESVLRMSGGFLEPGERVDSVGVWLQDDAKFEVTSAVFKLPAPWAGSIVLTDRSSAFIQGLQVPRACPETDKLFTEDECAPVLDVRDNATAILTGTDFNFPLGAPIDQQEGYIKGTLHNGDSIEWKFRRGPNAMIMLNEHTPGDYNGDGVVNLIDIDRQAETINSLYPDLATFDENEDGVVDFADRAIWVRERKRTWFGDANLDGEFNSGDLVAVFTAGEYEDAVEANSGWATGDWDGDLDFTSSDLVAALSDIGYEQGLRLPVKPVPESTAMTLLFLSLLVAGYRSHWITPNTR